MTSLTRNSLYRSLGLALVTGLLGLMISASTAFAQSTFGTILGTVKDNSGAVVPNASIKATNTDENASREVSTNGSGDYEFVNSRPGHYKVEVTAPGFKQFAATKLALAARQTLRVDAILAIGQATETVTVNAETAGVIATDTQAVQSSFDGNTVLALPTNIRGSANGSTSPYWMLPTLPGVQSDNGGNFSIQGGLRQQSQFSVDGIATTEVATYGNAPLEEASPSVEDIAEIKVQGVGSPAEFMSLGDVTTITKSGTNELHGALFWYHQNAALNATPYGSQTKPSLVSNDFGFRLGGPVLIPKIYEGKSKTFFFVDFEGLRLPQTSTITDQVPTQDMRNGNFSGTGTTIVDPSTGLPFPNNQIPADRISSIAQSFLTTLYPLPNAGGLNYVANHDATTTANQFDVRIDHYLTSKMSVFGRLSWKNRRIAVPEVLLAPDEHLSDNYRLLVTSWNWNIRPNLINEFRFGFTLNPATNSWPFNGEQFTNSLGLVGIGPTFPFNGFPTLSIGSYSMFGAGFTNFVTKNNTDQWINNTTWTINHHTFKFGFDIRKITAKSPQDLSGFTDYGSFSFSGTFSGDPVADFLLGLPQNTAVENIPHDSNGFATHYGIYAQDTFGVTPKLTLEYGLRWDHHPAYADKYGNIANFDPNVPLSGRVIFPDGTGNELSPAFLQSFNACPQLNSTVGPSANGAPCTPVFDNSHAHVPAGLRQAPGRFVPRFGFAYRPFSNDKTVVRGGFGIYNSVTLGGPFTNMASLQNNLAQFNNVSPTGGPIFQWPQIGAPSAGQTNPLGSAQFNKTVQINWKEPYTMQWNLSIERDLGFDTGLRVSYIGQGTRDLVWLPNVNQSPNSTTFYVNQPLSSRPFPNWGFITAQNVGATQNYNSLQVELSHRTRHGLTFNSTFTYAKNLGDNMGELPFQFTDENGNGHQSDYHNLRSDYGNVYGTRKLRSISTVVYELPFGKGRAFMSNANRVVDALLGGWRLSSIFLWQSGTFLTPYTVTGDPSGTGQDLIGQEMRVDRVKNGNLPHPTASQWIDPTAFVCPGVPDWTIGSPCTIGDNPATDVAPIGRFANSGVGIVTGPGQVVLSSALNKSFAITERVKFRLEGSFTNVPNHTNLGDPNYSNLNITSPTFGQITNARNSESGGNRTGQISARIEF
jgi:hypothetical protein